MLKNKKNRKKRVTLSHPTQYHQTQNWNPRDIYRRPERHCTTHKQATHRDTMRRGSQTAVDLVSARNQIHPSQHGVQYCANNNRISSAHHTARERDCIIGHCIALHTWPSNRGGTIVIMPRERRQQLQCDYPPIYDIYDIICVSIAQ